MLCCPFAFRLSENTHDGFLQFPQRLFSCYNIDFEQRTLDVSVLFQLFYPLNQIFHNLIVLQEDSVVIKLDLLDGILNTFGKLFDMLVVIRIVRVTHVILLHNPEMA